MDLLTFGISVLALLVSGATYYHQILRPAHLSLVPGENVALSYDSQGHLLFVMGVTIANKGAKTGMVTRLEGSIGPPQPGELASHEWYSFADSSAAGDPSTGFSPLRTVDAWVYTV